MHSHPVILFDGVCNLCSGSVQFVIKHDPKRHFRFASLQGNFGQSVLEKFGLPVGELGSFILLEDEKIYTRSSGALRVTRHLSGLWPVLTVFTIIPPFIRNAVYNWVAKNRYQWFGKKETCWVPNQELRDLFLD